MVMLVAIGKEENNNIFLSAFKTPNKTLLLNKKELLFEELLSGSSWKM